MSITKFLSTGVLAATALLSLSAHADEMSPKSATSYAPALSFKLGNPTSLSNCPNKCSASTGVEVGVDLMNTNWFAAADTKIELHTSVGLGYTNYQLNLNGNAVDFDSEAINVGFHLRHKALPNFSLAIHSDIFGMARTSGANTPRQLDFASAGDIAITYDVSPSFQASLGVGTHAVPVQNSRLTLNTVNLGISWSPVKSR